MLQEDIKKMKKTKDQNTGGEIAINESKRNYKDKISEIVLI